MENAECDVTRVEKEFVVMQILQIVRVYGQDDEVGRYRGYGSIILPSEDSRFRVG